MILTTLLAAAALLNGTQQQPLTRTAPAAVATTNTSVATAEGTEILRRILVASLDDAFTGDDHVAERRGLREHGVVTRLFTDSRTVQHSRAFHVPEAGLFLALDVSLPVVSRDAAAKDDKDGKNEKPTDDEWERMQREVRGQSQSTTDGFVLRRLRVQTPVDADVDPKAIESVIDVVLKTLARHATRVEGLGSRDTITVALRLGGRSRNFLQDFAGTPGALSLGEDGEDGAEKGDDETHTFSAYVIASGQDVREQSLTVRIAVSDLAGMADAGADKLRQRAQINLY